MKKEAKQFLGRLLAFFIVSAAIIAGTVLVRSFPPPDVIYSDDAFNWSYTPPDWNSSEYLVLLDSHSHTTHSDGVLTPEQNILWHKAHGFNAAVITDHNTLSGALAAREIANDKYPDFIVIVGMEWTTMRIHMTFLGLEEWTLPIPLNPTDAQIQEAIEAAQAQGAVVVACHFPWSLPRMPTHPTRMQLLEWGVDYLEVVNQQNPGFWDQDSYDFCLEHGLGMITATDMHYPEAVVGWTAVNASAFTEEAIMDALRARKTSIIYSVPGSPDHSMAPVDNPLHVPLRPIIAIGDVFVSMYYGGRVVILIGFAYLLGSFFVAEGLRIVKRKFWARRHQDTA